MSARGAAVLMAACLGVWGCSRAPTAGSDHPDGRGRYAGIGLYSPTRQWTKLMSAQGVNDPQTAQPIDDQAIIVVQDTATGEIRACGDLTGRCIGLNPWRTPLAADQRSPVKVTEHRAPDEAAASFSPPAQPPKTAKAHGGENGAAEPGGAAAP